MILLWIQNARGATFDLDLNPTVDLDGNVDVDPTVDLDVRQENVEAQSLRWGHRHTSPSRSTVESRSTTTTTKIVLGVQTSVTGIGSRLEILPC